MTLAAGRQTTPIPGDSPRAETRRPGAAAGIRDPMAIVRHATHGPWTNVTPGHATLADPTARAGNRGSLPAARRARRTPGR
ncbi:hypothetical protein EAS64_08080 [Trebonia kvetii]|uniref:Uncharacterized protein n=1 Tax=Trebonia kvetii TaxID=2480626 RepID=A0A6P2C7P1_9ACTN|nr:hypothetical protein [Trebonia kvetii]TVZ07240.1 hypothetical protein EAS64_08080 [Trebonia kvetii]